MKLKTAVTSALMLGVSLVGSSGAALACERNCDCATGYVTHHHHRHVWPGDAPRVYVAPPVVHVQPVTVYRSHYYVPAPRYYTEVRPYYHHRHYRHW